MSAYSFNSSSPVIEVAKLSGKRSTTTFQRAASVLAVVLGLAGLIGTATGHAHSLILLGFGMIAASAAVWLKRAVINMTPHLVGTTSALELLLPATIVAGYRQDLTGAQLWQLVEGHWETQFIIQRFEIPTEWIRAAMIQFAPAHNQIIDSAIWLAQNSGSQTISVGAFAVSMIGLNPSSEAVLTTVKIEAAELPEGVNWLERLQSRLKAKKPAYGGLARDWAAGFTPTLSQFAQNLSQQIEQADASYALQERTSQIDAVISSLGAASGSVVLVGETGIGKTALLYGLAERLLQGNTSPELRHHQVVALSAATMIAQVDRPGDLERIVLTCVSEAVSSGNMIVALDEAQLFFGQGVGAVNLSQLLLPVVQSRQLKMILTLTPGDWQKLRSTNTALASLLSPIVLAESTPLETLRLVADRALTMGGGEVVTYQAIKRADALSARYNTDEVNPGRTLKLLEASLSFQTQGYVMAASVEQAIESQYGVKVESATGAETDILLNLEEHIHQRMINQTRAVGVVASALRRARAGVSNPKRPIGSFLFLGPTGVGKTELAKSLAALYFGAESNMIRLDMTEYQQPSDVTRLLAGPEENPQGLLPRIKQQPFSVVLFDEIEKANPNILNLLLQLLDEGNLTDNTNKATSFKDAIIIATSNAGADEIRAHIEAGQALEAFEKEFIDQLISGGSFKPELLNRFDEIVLFRPLNEPELGQVVALLVAEVNHTLEPQKVIVELTPEAVIALVHAGYDPRLGARPMRRMVQRTVEDAVAGRILRKTATAGSTIRLDVADLNLPTANQS